MNNKSHEASPVNVEVLILVWEILLELCHVMGSGCDAQVEEEGFGGPGFGPHHHV